MKYTLLRRLILGSVLLLLTSNTTWAGSIFLTGHDPDFHAFGGNNAPGAQQFNQTAIRFILDPNFNSFAAAGISEFLFVESKISPPEGHTNGVNGIVASGYVPGVSFEIHDATDLNTQLNLLGTKYGGIVVASDFGGVLTQSELNILDARNNDIISFLNRGGGLYAMAESNGGASLTPGGGWYGFLPFVVSNTQFGQGESNNRVTAFGAALGLTNSDVNGNFSHNIIFTSAGGLTVVDTDSSGNILSLAGRGQVDPGTGVGQVPEPSSFFLFGAGMTAIVWFSRSRGKREPAY